MPLRRYHCLILLPTLLVAIPSVACAQGAGWNTSSPYTQRLPAVDQGYWTPSNLNEPYAEHSLQPQAPIASPHEELPAGPALSDLPEVDVMPPPDFARYAAIDQDFGPSIRVFEPKARVYFDTGWEDADKLDIFHDGSLSPSINFLELYWARPWADGIGHPDWRWGPNLGIGISSPADDSSDGTIQASGAPVLMVSYGLLFEFPLSTRQIDALRADPAVGRAVASRLRHLAPKAGVELGYALGVSSDETLDFSADGAIYVGVTVHVPN